MVSTAIIGAIVSVVGAIVSITFGIIGLRANAQKEVGDLYDQMMRFRNNHPEVLCLSCRWQNDLWARIYNQTQPEDAKWVTYYSYVELCLGYCNTVLFSKSRLSSDSYKFHHERLVKLILTEHNPIIEDLLEEGKFISPFIKKFREDLQLEGWDWKKEHETLTCRST